MTELAVVLPLLLAAVVALSIVVFVRMASAALRQTRGASRYELEVATLALRLEGALDPMVAVLDLARSGVGNPLDHAGQVTAARREVQSIAEAARRLEADHAAPHAARTRLIGAATQADGALAAASGAAGDTASGVQPGAVAGDIQRSTERALKRAFLDLVRAREEAAAVARPIRAGAGPGMAPPDPGTGRPAPSTTDGTGNVRPGGRGGVGG